MKLSIIVLLVTFLLGCSDKKNEDNKDVSKTLTSENNSKSTIRWDIQETVDAMTDTLSKTAYIFSKNGDRLSIMRKSNGSVWGYLELGGMNQFGTEKSLVFRIDKNEPIEVNDNLSLVGFNLFEWNPRHIGFQIWHLDGEIYDNCLIVGLLLRGNNLVFRYHPDNSTYKDVDFDISENKAAVREVLELDSDHCQ